MQVPLPAEESIKHLVVPKGFHPELFVSEEQLGGGKPICMNWDERGRLWVALTYDYPNNLQPPDQGHDRIVICEDTDGDGKADKAQGAGAVNRRTKSAAAVVMVASIRRCASGRTA
jgi:hypothetical protein